MKITQTLAPKDVFKQYSSLMLMFYLYSLIIMPLLTFFVCYAKFGFKFASDEEFQLFAKVMLMILAVYIFLTVNLRWTVFKIAKRGFNGKKDVEIYLEFGDNALKGWYLDDVNLEYDDIDDITKTSKYFFIKVTTSDKKSQKFVLKNNPTSQNFIKNLCSELGINL